MAQKRFIRTLPPLPKIDGELVTDVHVYTENGEIQSVRVVKAPDYKDSTSSFSATDRADIHFVNSPHSEPWQENDRVQIELVGDTDAFKIKEGRWTVNDEEKGEPFPL